MRASAKIKILLFFTFITFFLVLASWVAKFYFQTKETIDNDLEVSRCVNYEFQIDDINYQNGVLIFKITNNEITNYPIRTINFITDKQKLNYDLDEEIKSEDSKYVQINNIYIEKYFIIYVEGCLNLNKTYQIQ